MASKDNSKTSKAQEIEEIAEEAGKLLKEAKRLFFL